MIGVVRRALRDHPVVRKFLFKWHCARRQRSRRLFLDFLVAESNEATIESVILNQVRRLHLCNGLLSVFDVGKIRVGIELLLDLLLHGHCS